MQSLHSAIEGASAMATEQREDHLALMRFRAIAFPNRDRLCRYRPLLLRLPTANIALPVHDIYRLSPCYAPKDFSRGFLEGWGETSAPLPLAALE
jgi:hypothetical protein